MLRNQLVGGVVALALLCPARSAWAAGPDEAAAEALFRSGKQLMGERKFAEACPKLSESFRLDAATGTQLALALCYEQWGKLASAWSTYTTAADRSKQEGRADRERAARARAAALEPKLSRLTINVDQASSSLSGLTVSRNGVGVGSASFGVPLPVDPEEITVEASAPGRQPWSTKVTVGPNADQKVVTVPSLEENKSASSAPAPVSAPVSAPAEPHAAGSSGLSTMRIGAYAAGGAGIIALGLGGFFGLRAISKNGDSEDKGCDGNQCSTEEGKKLRDDAVSAGNVATIATIAGVVLAGTGVTLFVLDLNKKSSRSDGVGRVTFVPTVGRGDAGFSLVGKF